MVERAKGAEKASRVIALLIQMERYVKLVCALIGRHSRYGHVFSALKYQGVAN